MGRDTLQGSWRVVPGVQTGIARTADGLLLPSQGGGLMFQAFVEVALSPFKRSPIVVRTATTLCPVLSS